MPGLFGFGSTVDPSRSEPAHSTSRSSLISAAGYSGRAPQPYRPTTDSNDLKSSISSRLLRPETHPPSASKVSSEHQSRNRTTGAKSPRNQTSRRRPSKAIQDVRRSRAKSPPVAGRARDNNNTASHTRNVADDYRSRKHSTDHSISRRTRRSDRASTQSSRPQEGAAVTQPLSHPVFSRFNTSLTSLLSTWTGITDRSSGSTSTITQQSYDQAVKDIDQALASISVFDYMMSPRVAPRIHETPAHISPASSTYSTSEAGSSDGPGTPSSRSTAPSPTTFRFKPSPDSRYLEQDLGSRPHVMPARSYRRQPDKKLSKRAPVLAPAVKDVHNDDDQDDEIENDRDHAGYANDDDDNNQHDEDDEDENEDEDEEDDDDDDEDDDEDSEHDSDEDESNDIHDSTNDDNDRTLREHSYRVGDPDMANEQNRRSLILNANIQHDQPISHGRPSNHVDDENIESFSMRDSSYSEHRIRRPRSTRPAAETMQSQEEERRQHMAYASGAQAGFPHLGNALPRPQSAASMTSSQAGATLHLAMQHRYRPTPGPTQMQDPSSPTYSHARQLATAPPSQPSAPEAPDLSQTTLTGYEKIALQISTDKTGVSPLYRKFEYLNHRVLLHLQDELSELEEQLRIVDEVIAQLEPGPANMPRTPASRRGETYSQSEIHHRRIHLLGRIFQKTEQYNRAFSAYVAICNDSSTANASQVEAYREWMAENAPVHEVETRFLNKDKDLVHLGIKSHAATSSAPMQPHMGLDVASFQTITTYVPAALILPLLLCSIIPSIAGRLVVTVVIGMVASAVVSMTQMRNLLPIREYAICGAGYLVLVAVIAGCIPSR